MSKVSKSWTVKVRGHKRTVGVRRKPWLGIGIVEVDGERVGMFAAKALSMGFFTPHPDIHFEISGVSCMLKIHPGMLAYDYELYVDGKLLEPDVW